MLRDLGVPGYSTARAGYPVISCEFHGNVDLHFLTTGNVTTERNGGFASVRSETWGGFMAFQRSEGIRMVVQGDGRTFKLSVKDDASFDGVMYQHDFPTSNDGQWRTVDLPFSSFKPNFRGQLVPGRPPILGSQIRQLGIMVSKFSDAGGLTSGFRTGSFSLALSSIKGFF